MAATTSSISAGAEEVVLARGPLRVELALRPFSITIRRAGRRLLRSGGLWVANGTIKDHFIQFTEGVVAREERTPAERAVRATAVEQDGDELQLSVLLQGGRRAQLRVGLPKDDRVALRLVADDEPLRLALEWDRRSEERFIGLDARACWSAERAAPVRADARRAAARILPRDRMAGAAARVGLRFLEEPGRLRAPG